MKIFLRDQRHRFQVHLEEFMKHPVMPYDLKHLSEKTSSIRIPHHTPGKAGENIIFDYRIFPNHIMSCFGQWHAENRSMQVGDTIVQQVNIPPAKAFSQKIVFGVRIKEMINEPGKIGFSYETLLGHAEKGISTFC